VNVTRYKPYEEVSNLLGKDYVKDEILIRLETTKPEDIADQLGIDVLIISSIQFVKEYEESFGDILTAYDIEKLYVGGLTFSEIGYLRGNTKEGVRVALDKVVGKNKDIIKRKHRKVRDQIRDRILYEKVFKLVKKKGKEDACKELGYSRTYFNVLYRRLEKVGEKIDEGYIT